MLMCSKDVEHAVDGVTDLSAQIQPPNNPTTRHFRAVSPVLRPDSTVMSEERGAVPDTNDHERAQATTSSSASDSVGGLSTTQSQRPPLWNPFLAAATAASRVPGGEGESERRPRDGGSAPPAKVGAGTKHSHPGDDETISPVKKRKTSSKAQDVNSCVELTDAVLRTSGQSPSSSTLDTQAPTTRNGELTVTDAQDCCGGGVCAPDSSCDEQSSTSELKRFECVAKHASRSSVQKDLTMVGGVQETGSLLSLATQ